MLNKTIFYQNFIKSESDNQAIPINVKYHEPRDTTNQEIPTIQVPMNAQRRRNINKVLAVLQEISSLC